MLRDYPEDFYTDASLSKPLLFVCNGVIQRPERLCSECGKPLPEKRAWNQVAHKQACQDARDARAAKRAGQRRREQSAAAARFGVYPKP